MKQVNPVDFGRRLRERRKEVGFTQPKLAEFFKQRKVRGFSQQNLVTLEKGSVIKDLRRQAIDLAGPLRTTEEWLLYGTGEKEVGPRVLTSAEYEALPFDLQREITALVESRATKRKRA